MVNKQVKSGKNKVDTDTRQTQVIHEYLQFNIGHSFILFFNKHNIPSLPAS